MKRIAFLIIASLMVIGLVLPGTAMAATPLPIKVIIAGPMAYAQGQDMVRGAQLAANEIGTITVNGTDFSFTIITCDTNEISDSGGAGAKLATYLDGEAGTRRIVAGGFRTEGVNNEMPIILNRTALFMIVGAATSTLLATYAPNPIVGVPYYNSNATSAGYKYVFRASPFNSTFLVNNIVMMLKMVCDNIRLAMGWNMTYNATGVDTSNRTVRIGIFSESLEWALPMVSTLQSRITAFGAAFGWTLGITRTVSDQAGSSVVTPALNALRADKCHVIATVLSGPVGTVFSQKKGELGIPAIAAGINVLAQESTFWEDTEGYCESDILMSTWAPGVNQTVKTAPFIAAFQAAYGKFPSYTAATYDVIYNLKAAILNRGWNATDGASVQASVDNLIPYFEDVANKQTGTSGVNAFFPMWDGVTTRYISTYFQTLPALNVTQLDALYATTGYLTPGGASNYTMPSFISHDLVYGPGWVTGIFVQWRKV